MWGGPDEWWSGSGRFPMEPQHSFHNQRLKECAASHSAFLDGTSPLRHEDQASLDGQDSD